MLNKSISNSNFIFGFFLLFSALKVIVLTIAFSDFSLFTSDGDAAKYHLAAEGHIEMSSSIWGALLHQLYLLNFYNRDYISIFLMFLQSFIIPFLLIIASVNFRTIKKKSAILFAFLFSLYPTQILFSMDIYRDIFMLFIFMCVLILMRLSVNSLAKQIFIVLIFSIILFSFRKYLGFGLAAGWILGFIIYYSLIRRNYKIMFLILMILLFILFEKSPIIHLLSEYRSGFDIGASTMFFMHSILENSPLLGIFLSFFLQIGGLYIASFVYALFFIFETVPFLLSAYYIFKNKEYWDRYIAFLLGFFIAYSVVWIFASINMGTGVRLRIFSYTVIFIAAIRIHYLKKEKLTTAFLCKLQKNSYDNCNHRG